MPVHWRRFIKRLGEQLKKDDIKTLKYLYSDIIGAADNIDSGLSILERLEQCNVFVECDPSPLKDLLDLIPRRDLISLVDDYIENSEILQSGPVDNVDNLPVASPEQSGKLSDYNGFGDTQSQEYGQNDYVCITPPPTYNEVVSTHSSPGTKTISASGLNVELATGSTQQTHLIHSMGKLNLENQAITAEPSSRVRPVSTRQKEYDVETINCGKCLIINNMKFNNVQAEDSGEILATRKGSDVDEAALREVFQWLGFQVDVIPDCTASQLKISLSRYAEMDHSDYTIFVIVILSHGFDGGVYCIDGCRIFSPEILAMFEIVPSLAGKPKLCFIQACQGKTDQKYVEVHSDSGGNIRSQSGKLIPQNADFLLAIATTPGTVSWRSPSTGTWYIQELCKQFKLHAHEWHILEIMTEVNFNLSYRQAHVGDTIAKQIADTPRNTLRMKLYLRPPCSFETWQRMQQTPS